MPLSSFEQPQACRVTLYSAFFSERWPDSRFTTLLAQLPLALQQQVLRFRRWQDRQCTLLGKLLLLEALSAAGHGPERLAQLRYSAHGRPSLPGAADFNISHSHQAVVCAWSDCGCVGVDIERKRPANPRDFTLCMSSGQIDQLQRQPRPNLALLELWVEKESVAKAHGVGLNYDFRQLQSQQGRYRIDQSDYWVRPVVLHGDYVCCVSSERADIELEVKPAWSEPTDVGYNYLP